MADGAEIRDFTPADTNEVKLIHESSGLDYRFPDIQSPLHLVKKVLSIDGKVRVCVSGYLTCEAYLWIDPSDWADPEQKLIAIQELERAAMDDAREKGLEEVILFLPPEMERFGRRLVEDLGFSKDRSSWSSYSKKL